MKKCSCCNEYKSLTEFHKCKSRKDGYKEYCKICRKLKGQRDWLKLRTNPEALLKRKILKAKWDSENKEHKRKYIRNYCHNRFHSDINYRILVNLRNRIVKVIKRNSKSNNTVKLVGCSIEFLKIHLEKQFKPGMNWDNYGKWHIDHIKPCSKFNLSKDTEQKKCFNFKNLQPLWEEENLAKSNIY